MSWELIIFDCDGVLVNSEPIATRVFSEMLAEIGLPMSYEETARTFIGVSTPDCLDIIRERLGRPAPPGFSQELESRILAAFPGELKPIAGIAEVLERIPHPVCVASNSEPGWVRTTLELTGLLSHFEGRLFSAVEVTRGKPAPDLFLHAARRMGASPEHCAVVEDSPPGVRAGVSAGMAVFGYAGAFGPEALAGAGARVFRRMADLPGLLGVGMDHNSPK